MCNGICQPSQDRASTPRSLQRDRQQADRYLFTGRDDGVIFPGIMHRADITRPGHELVRRARHGRDDDGDTVPSIHLRLHPGSNIADPVQITNRGTAKFLNNERHFYLMVAADLRNRSFHSDNGRMGQARGHDGRPEEIDNFAAMSAQWWDESGPMAPLHDFTPVRIDYILDSIRRIGTGSDGGPAGLRVLDIGCGGGLLAEPMARLGAQVTGIDATPQAIDAAKAHAAAGGLAIDYQCRTAESLAETGARFDVIYASEVIEHVTDRRLFARAIAAMLAPGGTVIITTINRTLASLALAKVALEYVFRLVPAGTHDPARFVKPAELRSEFAAAGIILDEMTGFAPLPARRIGGNGFVRVGSLAVNYAASGTQA